MSDWREPGEEWPAGEPEWQEQADGPHEFYPPAEANRDHLPRGSVLKLVAATLLCLLAGAVATAGLNLRQQTFLGWLVVLAGVLLVIPAARLGVRSLVRLLVAFNQLRQEEREPTNGTDRTEEER